MIVASTAEVRRILEEAGVVDAEPLDRGRRRPPRKGEQRSRERCSSEKVMRPSATCSALLAERLRRAADRPRRASSPTADVDEWLPEDRRAEGTACCRSRRSASFLTIAVANPFDVVAARRPAARRRAASSGRSSRSSRDQARDHAAALPTATSRRSTSCSRARTTATSRSRRARSTRTTSTSPTLGERGRAGRQARQPDHLPGASRRRRPTSTSSRSRSATRVRYRVDGVLAEVDEPPQEHARTRSSRASRSWRALDIAEKRRAAGRQVPDQGRGPADRLPPLDPAGRRTARRSCCASSTRRTSRCKLDDARLRAAVRSTTIRKAIDAPYGMILVTGPDRLGQVDDALLRASTRSLTPDINFVTVEDPVEYQLDGVNQVPVNVKRGLTFAGALRSILRQDPDVDPDRRDPRHRDDRHRDQGRAHRPPRALDAAHERRAVDDHAHDRHGRRPVHGVVARRCSSARSASRASSASTASSRSRCPSERLLARRAARRRRSPQARSSSSAVGLRALQRRATGAASRSSRRCRSTRTSSGWSSSGGQRHRAAARPAIGDGMITLRRAGLAQRAARQHDARGGPARDAATDDQQPAAGDTPRTAMTTLQVRGRGPADGKTVKGTRQATPTGNDGRRRAATQEPAGGRRRGASQDARADRRPARPRRRPRPLGQARAQAAAARARRASSSSSRASSRR